MKDQHMPPVRAPWGAETLSANAGASWTPFRARQLVSDRLGVDHPDHCHDVRLDGVRELRPRRHRKPQITVTSPLSRSNDWNAIEERKVQSKRRTVVGPM